MPHSPAAHLPFPAIEQHINQLLLTQAHGTETLQVVALRTEAEHGHLSLCADQGQGAYGALGMLPGIEVIGDLAQGLGGVAPVLPLEIQNLDGHTVTIWCVCA